MVTYLGRKKQTCNEIHMIAPAFVWGTLHWLLIGESLQRRPCLGFMKWRFIVTQTPFQAAAGSRNWILINKHIVLVWDESLKFSKASHTVPHTSAGRVHALDTLFDFRNVAAAQRAKKVNVLQKDETKRRQECRHANGKGGKTHPSLFTHFQSQMCHRPPSLSSVCGGSATLYWEGKWTCGNATREAHRKGSAA